MVRIGRKSALAAAAIGVATFRLLGSLRQADLRGEVALVTGSSRGFGFLLAREFGRQGCRVVICARNEVELARARQALQAEGIETLAVPCDISDRTQAEHLIDQATAHFGRVDILVNNAGIIQVGPVETMTVDDFEGAAAVMYLGTVYPTLAALPQMRARRFGRIVNITSIGGRVAMPHLLPYDAAKFAAVGFSEGLHAEVANDGITVTTILPGLMRVGSFVHADYRGDAAGEAAWFSVASSLPLITLNAERAARQVVEATRRGETERTLGVIFMLAGRVKGLMPGLTVDILSLLDSYVLPRGSDNQSHDTAAPERSAQAALNVPIIRLLTSLGRSAGQRYNETPGPVGQSSDQRS